MTPDELRNGSVLIGDRRGEDGRTTTTSAVDAKAVVASREMRARGIVNPDELLAFATPAAVLGACRWWDSQPSAGAGVLAKVIRSGGMDGWQPKVSTQAMYQRSAAYQAGVWDWLAENFPDLCDDHGLASPHAVAAVFRLHAVHGKGSLTVDEHGPLIRAAVQAADTKTGELNG